ncbi:hypothetical protein MUO98_02090 [Candidatus Bathyarchaeota archaeon]|nr:hypothetical protein [Candidatus Bathyarchaeota archaeon]
MLAWQVAFAKTSPKSWTKGEKIREEIETRKASGVFIIKKLIEMVG